MASNGECRIEIENDPKDMNPPNQIQLCEIPAAVISEDDRPQDDRPQDDRPQDDRQQDDRQQDDRQQAADLQDANPQAVVVSQPTPYGSLGTSVVSLASTSTSTSSSSGSVQSSPPICRYCMDGPSPGDALIISPCVVCEGSVRYMHYSCFSSWTATRYSSRTECEICRNQLPFREVLRSWREVNMIRARERERGGREGEKGKRWRERDRKRERGTERGIERERDMERERGT